MRPLLGLVLVSAPALGAEWPALTTPPEPTGGGEGDAAVIVGIEDYAFVDDVVGARQNAEDWYRYLTKTRGVPVGQARLLRDGEAADHAILSAVRAAAGEVSSDGTMWFVFIGHGAPAKDGMDGLLVGVDAARSADGIYERSVSRAELIREMETGAQSNTVVLLDACFSGQGTTGAALVDGLQPLVPSFMTPAGTATVLTAAAADQFAGRLPGETRPAFSYLALGALRGWGDTDGDGVVTAREVVDYADQALVATVRGRSQRPQLSGPGLALGRGSEPGPDLVELALGPPQTEVTPAGDVRVVTGGDDYLAQLTQLKDAQRRRQEAEEEERRLASLVQRERTERVQAARSALLEQASANWEATVPFLGGGGPEAVSAVEAFIRTYGSARVEIDDYAEDVTVPEVATARSWLQEHQARQAAVTVGPAADISVSSAILALPDPASSEWDGKVKALVLSGFDRDGSGEIDTASEVSGMDCDTWRALDISVRGSQYENAFTTIYGVKPGLMWLGNLVGLSEGVQDAAWQRASECGAADAGSAPAPAVVSPPTTGATDVAAAITALPEPASSTWDASVKELLLSGWDANGSGGLDASEVDAVSCDAWTAIDQAVRRSQYHNSFHTIYGIESGTIWLGYTIGIDAVHQGRTLARLQSCGLVSGAAPTSSSLSDAILALSNPASSPWDAEVKELMVGQWDRNGSGDLDTSSEVSAVDCATWSAIDTGVRRSYSSGFAQIYGIKPGLLWIGSAVGISPAMQSQTLARLETCGLVSGGAAPRPSTSIPQAIQALPAPASSSWDASVKELLVDRWDANGSGDLDTSSEVSAVDCATWGAIDDGVERSSYSSGFAQIYGVKPGGVWVGYAIGIPESRRSQLLSELQSCGLVSGGANSGTSSGGADLAGVISALSDPASSEWDRQVKSLFISAYDANGSMEVDTSSEVGAIPCGTWQALDQAARGSSYSTGFATLYGINPDPSLNWVGYAIGLDESIRSRAHEAMSACGVGY